MSKRLVRFLILSAFSVSVGAQELAPPPLAKGQTIQVMNWDQKSRTYELLKTKFPAQGPNFVTLSDLLAAVKTLDGKKIEKKPALIVGNEYQLDQQLPLQPVLKVMKQRQAGKSPAKK